MSVSPAGESPAHTVPGVEVTMIASAASPCGSRKSSGMLHEPGAHLAADAQAENDARDREVRAHDVLEHDERQSQCDIQTLHARLQRPQRRADHASARASSDAEQRCARARASGSAAATSP